MSAKLKPSQIGADPKLNGTVPFSDTWQFPFDEVIRSDDDGLREHHSRKDTCFAYGLKHDMALVAMAQTGNRKILEIGLRAGYAAYAFLAAAPELYVAIDNDLDGERAHWGGRRGWSLEAHLLNVARFPASRQILLLGDSHWLASYTLAEELGPYGLVHVDGDHSLRGAWEDLMMYSCLVAPGGAMLVDGLNWDPGTQIAVGRFRSTHQYWTYRTFETRSFGGDALLVKPTEAEELQAPARAGVS